MKTDIFFILSDFRGQFSRNAAFVWFLVAVFGFLLRFDSYGVTSFIRWLGLASDCYPLLLHFFYANSWSHGKLMMQWMQWCISNFSIVRLNGRVLCIGDGIKVPKEAKKQPGLKRLHNESQNSTKPEKFTGHYFGCLCFIAEKFGKYFGVLQAAEIQQGVDKLRKLSGEEIEGKTLVTKMVNLAIIVAVSQNIPLYLCLDAFFAAGPAFALAALHLTDAGQPWVHIITKAKSNYVAYPDKGRKKSNKIKLSDMFGQSGSFLAAPHPIHPEREILYFYMDLYWSSVTGLIRFVWVIDGKNHFVLMCSDITLSPLDVLRGYGLRAKIEVAFLVLKHIIGGFCYRFWTKFQDALPKNKKEGVLPVLSDRKRANKCLETLRAIERFVNLAIIAQGILQYLAVSHTAAVWRIHSATSWLRTYSSDIPSEETVKRALQAEMLASSNSTTCYEWIKSLAGQVKRPKLPSKVPKNDTLGSVFLD